MPREPKPYRKTVVRYLDAAGKRIPKPAGKRLPPGVRREKVKTETYYARVVVDGKSIVVSLKKKDYGEALIALRDRVILEARRERGIADQYTEAADRPLKDHVEDLRRELLASGITPKHAHSVCNNILRLAALARWKRLGDIRAGSCLDGLARLRDDAPFKTSTRHPGRSAQTRNHYLKHAKQFTAWLVDDDRLQRDPLRRVDYLPLEGQSRHARRTPTDAEIGRLFAHLYSGQASERCGLSGPQRAMGYKVALATGFRALELRSLTRASFDLDAGRVTCRAAADKRRRTAEQVIPPWLVDELRAWFAAGGGTWENVPESSPGPRLLGYDLAAAGVPWKVDGPEGELFFDFHSLRRWYITQLANQPGISPKTLMALSRHSTPTLSLQVYADARDEDLRAAAGHIPNPAPQPTPRP